MIPKDEALSILHAAIPARTGIEEVDLVDAVGRVLAEDAISDLDIPPFNRSAMDGFAVRSADLAEAPVDLRVAETIKAGAPSSRVLQSGECTRIMTGAAVPEGADAVVMVEATEEPEPDLIRFAGSAVAGQHIAPRGQDVKLDDVVVHAGSPIRPIEIGMLATVGQARVKVFRAPSVAVIATGDELIEPGEGVPGPGQIRESNGAMLTAQVRSLGLGISADYLGIARDDPASVRAMIERGLAHDVVVLSGGVSMGDFDFVHTELEARGLTVLLEKVAIKPGKPLVFGHLDVDGRRVFVFGLPGNPVSSYVTFEIFVRPFLRGLMGRPGPHVLELDVVVAGDAKGKAIPRTQHLPARIASGASGLVARVVPWNGSGDLTGLLDANGFVIVPAGEAPPREGDRARVLLTEPDALRLPPHRSRADA